MDDGVAEVDEHPAGVRRALGAGGADALVAEVAVERVEDGAHLAGIRGGGDDEDVGEGGDGTDVHQHDVLGLAVGE